MTIEMIEAQMPDKPMKNIYQKILGVMADVSYIQKGDRTVNGQYRFVSHDQVTGALHDAVVKHGIVVISSIKEIKQEGNRTHVELYVEFINCDNPIDRFYVSYHGYGIDAGDKGIGKAVSYAFKYACTKVFMLETGEDPDNDANARYEPAKCHEFDSVTPPDGDTVRFKIFVDNCVEVAGIHPEDFKREAMTKLDSFLSAYMKWKPKKTTKDK